MWLAGLDHLFAKALKDVIVDTLGAKTVQKVEDRLFEKYGISLTQGLEEFEKYVFDIVKSIKFRNGSDNFQNKLRSDTLSKKSSNMFIFAGKTSKI